MQRVKIISTGDGQERRRTLAFNEGELEYGDNRVRVSGDLRYELLNALKWIEPRAGLGESCELELDNGIRLVGCRVVEPRTTDAEFWTMLEVIGYVEFTYEDAR